MKRVVLVLCAFAFGMLFTSCSIPAPSIDELMQAPKLSAEQTAVNNALENTLGTDNYTLKYPRSGAYRSAFVFYDIDMDGVEEAIVFYQFGSNNSDTRIHILDFIEGAWNSCFDLPGKDSGEVDYIQFESIESSKHKNILVGWQFNNPQIKQISIYAYESTELVTRYEQEYVHSVIRDFNQDGLMDVVLVSQRRSNPYKLLLVSVLRSKIREVDSFSFGTNVNGISQLLYGKLPDGRSALYVDVALRNARYATEIIAMEENILLPMIKVNEIDLSMVDLTEPQPLANNLMPGTAFVPVTGEAAAPIPPLPIDQMILNFKATVRVEEVLSADINDDGVIEVPSSSPMLGYEPTHEEEDSETQEKERKYLSTYSVLKNGVMTPIVNACVNLRGGYMVCFPERWIGQVTIYSENDLSQWQFFKYTGSINDPSIELLRINRIVKNDYQDRFVTNPILLAPEQNSMYQYYGYLPPTQEKELALSESELRTLFRLL